jgi:ribosomal protein S18 acetylase RimI-like enzyme
VSDETIRIAKTDAEILSCFPVLRQLHEHIAEAAFVAQVRQFQSSGYQLAFCEGDGAVRSVAGFRFGESFGWRRYLYLHEIVTDGDARSQGHGARLMAWLMERAREHGCDTFHLDSRVTRNAAHKFYLNEGFTINAYHFRIEVSGHETRDR